MNGFIEVSLGKDKVILAVSHIFSIGVEANGKTGIYMTEMMPNHLESDESLPEVIAKIEAAQGETITAELCQAKDVNVYYRTADRLPTREDADSTQMLLASQDREEWFYIDLDSVEKWKLWAPVPKVEARP